MSKKRTRQLKAQEDQGRQFRSGFFRKREPSFYLVSAILFLSCFILFLPLVVNYDFYYPYVFLKSILFRIAVQAMVFLYVILALISPAHRPRFHRLTYGMLLWFAVMLLSSLPGISVNAWRSWWGDFMRMEGMFAHLHLLAYFFVLAQVFKQDREWLTLFTTSLFFSGWMGVTGLIQATGIHAVFRFDPQETRIQGAAGNANFLASYLLLNIFIAIYFLLRKNKANLYPFIAKLWLILLIAFDLWLVSWDLSTGGQVLTSGLQFVPLMLFALVLHGLTLFWFFMRRNVWAGTIFLSILCLWDLYWMNSTLTRATVIGLGGGLTFLVLVYIWQGTARKMRWAAALALVLFATMAAIIVAHRDSGWVRNNPLLVRFSATNLGERRFVSWKSIGLGIMDRPILGWGLEHYRQAIDLHAPVALFRGRDAENWEDRAHNIVLDSTVTTGFVGLAALAMFYGLLFFHLMQGWFRNREATEYLSITALFVAYLIQALFLFDTLNTQLILFLLLAYAVHICRRPSPDSAESQVSALGEKRLSFGGYAILVLAAGILICAFHYLVSDPLESNRLLQRGITLRTAAGLQPEATRYASRNLILEDFRRAEAYRTTGRYEVREELENYAAELMLASDIPLQERARVANTALELLDSSIREDPSDARNYMHAAALANACMDVIRKSDPAAERPVLEKGMGYLKKAEGLNPGRPRLFLIRAALLVNMGQIGEAIAILKKATELDPENWRMRVELVAAYIIADRYNEAGIQWQVLRSYPGVLSPADYERIIGIYYSKKQMAAVVELLKEQLKESPDDPAILSRLAAVYRDSGDVESARQTALKAAKLSPQLATQLDAFLKTLESNPKK